MSAKRRLIFNLMSLCLVMIVAITSVSLVLASLSATVNSGFSITYTATSKDVKAGIVGSYLVNYGSWMDGPNSAKNFTCDGNNYIEFDGSSQGTKNFDEIGEVSGERENVF